MLLRHKTTLQPLEVTLRPFRPSDAPHIIACIRDAYGDTYVKPYLYTEEGILDHEKNGELCFSVAETPEGRIAGITAYARSGPFFPGMSEIACQVILQEFNGYGLALPLALHAMERAERLPLAGQYSRALGCHLISQKTLKGMGFTACGFLLNVFNKEKFTYRYRNGGYAKVPQSLAVKRQDAADLGPLFLPEEWEPLAEQAFRHLGVSWERAPGGELSGPDEWAWEDDEVHATLYLWAKTCGKEFPAHLAAALQAEAAHKDGTVNLFLSLSRPGSAAAYEEARRLGFFPTAILPCTADGTYLLLHHPLQVPVRLDEIPCIPEYEPFLGQIRRQL